jgi:hypothetical protein
MSLPTGLSALIEAATSQLGQVSNGDSVTSAVTLPVKHADTETGVTTDDGASSDGGEKLEDTAKHTQTPVIVPEPDPLRHTFPELLMTLSVDPKNIDTIAFLPDGKFLAIRVDDFARGLMKEYFPVTTFAGFLELINEWGFTRLNKDAIETGIEIFRHPHFIKGDFMKCRGIKFGENPTDARVDALPEAARIEYTVSDDSAGSTANVKRRLSPGFIKRRESETSTIMKRRHSSKGHHSSTVCGDADNPDSTSNLSKDRADEIRSIALALTTEKLNLRQETSPSSTSGPRKSLVDQAVKSATHTIVTDAIESLLTDEVHTKQTYLKHEKELSKSSLPGVVPISKVLFEKEKKEQTTTGTMPRPNAIRRRSSGIEELSIAAAIKAEELREESERELRKSTASSTATSTGMAGETK